MPQNGPHIHEFFDLASRLSMSLQHSAISAEDGLEVGSLLGALERLLLSLETHFEEQRLIQDVARQANSGIILDEILEQVYASFRALIPYDRIGLALLEAGGAVLRARWARSEASVVRLTFGYTGRMPGSSLQTIMETGRPRVLNDLAAYLEAHPQSEATRLIVEEGMRSSLTCPLVAIGRPVGFLFFSSRVPGRYKDIHADIFIQLAEQLSMIVEKARLYEELQETNRRLEAEIAERRRTEEVLRRTKHQLESVNRKLDLLASQDGLTGLANRRTFEAALEREWGRARRQQRPIALILADVDFFKNYNDGHGHLAGDDCLRSVARVLRGSARRPSDLAARYGGEEFAVLLPDTEEAPALAIAERMRKAVEALRIEHGRSPVSGCVTLSLGVACRAPRPEGPAAELLDAADRRLYAAKHSGRNRCVAADPSTE